MYARRVEQYVLSSKYPYGVDPFCIRPSQDVPTPLRSFRNAARSETSSSERPPRRHRRQITPLTQGAHPFSSFEKTLQGREAVEENLYIRDKEAAAKYKREAELQAERLADASKAFKKEFSQELATMLHQKHLAERQKALRK